VARGLPACDWLVWSVVFVCAVGIHKMSLREGRYVNQNTFYVSLQKYKLRPPPPPSRVNTVGLIANFLSHIFEPPVRASACTTRVLSFCGSVSGGGVWSLFLANAHKKKVHACEVR
jgi:hypothetical protein